jgi:hypothetical protein
MLARATAARRQSRIREIVPATRISTSSSARASVVAGRMPLTLPVDAQVHRADDRGREVVVVECFQDNLVVGADV